LNGLLERSGDPLSTVPEKDRDTGWTDHAIIVGYGPRRRDHRRVIDRRTPAQAPW
jgi:hypothetical protein